MNIIEFSNQINLLRQLIKNKENAKIKQTVWLITELINKEQSLVEKEKLLQFFEKFIKIYDLEHTLNKEKVLQNNYEYHSSQVLCEKEISIDKHVKKVGRGVSLVTCCMNRNENLIKALPSWIECDNINEIIIVDWSSKEPVFDYLKMNGIQDKRIKIIRIDDQPRWILSYAFNIGFRMASYDRILKTDADIIVKPDFFEKNKLSNTTFISGDWRIAPKGQEHINGFFYIYRENLMNIKGFNEYITTYGWDDDDIYNRLESSGTKRTHVDIETIYHIPHDDSLRFSTNESNLIDYLDEFTKSTKFKIRTNRFIANIMPTWNNDRVFLPLKIKNCKEGLITIYKNGESIHYVPEHIRDDAEYYAALELTSWQVGLRAFDLDKLNLRKLLQSKSFEKINRLDIEIAIHNKASTYTFKQNNLVIKISPNIVNQYKSTLSDVLVKLELLLSSMNKGLILSSATRSEIASIIPTGNSTGFIPYWRNYGSLDAVQVIDLVKRISYPEDMQMIIDQSSISDLINLNLDSMLAENKPNDKLYIDAQHGLGNRLRAIASGAAIAEATDRELVIVWEPDHHCECRFSDLFEYEGKVIEKSFIKEAIRNGSLIYNYMEIEENSNKDELIKIEANKDVYVRSAYVLNSEYTNWTNENIFLQNLIPTKQVLDLIEPFNVSNCIGAHVRMEAGKGLDHNTYDSVENWTEDGHEQLHFWREKSHYSHFIKRIDQLFKENPNSRLFLATDLPETYQVFENCYGDKLSYLKRNVYDRSKEQIIYALADVILLSKCERLLGSTWSSFSELAMRLSKTYSKIEMSGNDF